MPLNSRRVAVRFDTFKIFGLVSDVFISDLELFNGSGHITFIGQDSWTYLFILRMFFNAWLCCFRLDMPSK